MAGKKKVVKKKEEMPMGKHKMPNGMMMSDSEMKKQRKKMMKKGY